MQLQVALDRIELDVAVELAESLAEHADRIEVGTSLVKRYGMSAVSQVVAASAPTPVLADLKTADDAETEFGMAFAHGARAATVLAQAGDDTIRRCVRTAEQHEAEVLLDLLATTDERRDHLLSTLPRHVVIGAHLGKDAQGLRISAGSLLGSWADERRVALAGGLSAEQVQALSEDHPKLRVIVGSAITKADDPVAQANRMRSAMKGEHG